MQYYPEFQSMQQYFQCHRFKDKNNFCTEQDFAGWEELKKKRNDPVYIALLSPLM